MKMIIDDEELFVIHQRLIRAEKEIDKAEELMRSKARKSEFRAEFVDMCLAILQQLSFMEVARYGITGMKGYSVHDYVELLGDVLRLEKRLVVTHTDLREHLNVINQI